MRAVRRPQNDQRAESRLPDNLIPPITQGRPCERPGIPGGSAAGERVALSSSAHRSQGRAVSSAPLNLTRLPVRHVASLPSPARSLGHSTTAAKAASAGVAGRVSVPLFRAAPQRKAPGRSGVRCSAAFVAVAASRSSSIASALARVLPPGIPRSAGSHAPRLSSTLPVPRSTPSAWPSNPACSGLRFARR
jgi:hypothetical protein